MKILIIDDSMCDRRLLMHILEYADIENEIIQACDGEEGLRLLKENYESICLVLLDGEMPKLTGNEFMQKVNKYSHLRRIPIIMITVSETDQSVRKAYESNPSLANYLIKPYKVEELLETVLPYIK